MKKIYQHPETIVIKISAMSLLNSSPTADNLSGFGGYGGNETGRSADSRGYDFDEEDEYE